MDAKGLVFALLLGWSGWVAACEDLLRASPHRISIEKFYLSPNASRDLAVLGITRDDFTTYFLPDDYVPAFDGEKFWLVVFNHHIDNLDRGHMDKGFRVVGQRDGKRLRIERVARASRENEQGYFRFLATRHKIEEKVFSVGRKMINCRSIFIKPWTQVKLWVKHRINLADVQSVFDHPVEGPIYDRSHGENRYAVRGLSLDGRMIRAVIGTEDRECPLTLITSFEESF